jgi:enamine deaminase RidA (YjgF/YER057c/UK114 family)
MLDIVKLNVYVTDWPGYYDHLDELGEVHEAYFGDYYPAMAFYEVKTLFQPDALVECEGIAVIEPDEIA